MECDPIGACKDPQGRGNFRNQIGEDDPPCVNCSSVSSSEEDGDVSELVANEQKMWILNPCCSGEL